MQARANTQGETPKKCSVLVIARSNSLRSGLQALLGSVPEVEQVYLAGTCREAQEIIRAKPIRLVILDREYPDNDLLSLIKELGNRKISLIALGDRDNSSEVDVETATYVTKGVHPEKLLTEIRKKC